MEKIVTPGCALSCGGDYQADYHIQENHVRMIAPEQEIGASSNDVIWRQWRQCEVGISGGIHYKIKTLMPSLWPNFRK